MTDRRFLSVRLPVELIERLDRQAERRAVSRNLLLQRAAEAALDEWEDYDDVLDRETR